MNHQKIFKEIKKLEKQKIELFKKLEIQGILKSKPWLYTKQDKESFKLLWIEYIKFFSYLQKLIRKSYYRKYFFIIDYNKFILRKYLLIFYYKTIVDLLDIFWFHEQFLRVFLGDNFKKDFWIFAKYIYKPRFINLINTPNIFIKPFKNFIDKGIYRLLDSEYMNIVLDKRIFTDYSNIYFYIKARIDKILFFISKHIWYYISITRFSPRKNGLITKDQIDEYLKIAKPWDIFLSRWNRNASNLFIPWFWKHMSMYVWDWKFLRENFKFLENVSLEAHYIIEATGNWINIVPIYDFANHQDYLWISRTNFKKEKILRSIKNALKNIWKWYDHIFNFYSDKNLVCSELILKSYSKEFKNDEWIDIDLEYIWSSLTFPPNNFILKLIEENNNNRKKVFPIFFIDALEKDQNSFISTSKDLLETYKRPKLTLFLK